MCYFNKFTGVMQFSRPEDFRPALKVRNHVQLQTLPYRYIYSIIPTVFTWKVHKDIVWYNAGHTCTYMACTVWRICQSRCDPDVM